MIISLGGQQISSVHLLFVIFHEDYLKVTTLNAQIKRAQTSRPVVIFKLDIIVTVDMMGAIFATLHKQNILSP